MEYTKSIPVGLNGQAALKTLRDAFKAAGFRELDSSSKSFEAQGPGMRNSKQDPLRGVSRVSVAVFGRELQLDADLDGLRNLQRFVLFFPPALILALIGCMAAIMPQPEFRRTLPGLLLALIPIGIIDLVVVPLMPRCTIRRLDKLLASLDATQSAKPTVATRAKVIPHTHQP